MQFAGVFVLAQFGQRFGFDLADAFAGDAEFLADFFERVALAVFQAEAQFEYLLLALGQPREMSLTCSFSSLLVADFSGVTVSSSSMKSPSTVSSSSSRTLASRLECPA